MFQGNTKCKLSHSELLIPRKSAIEEVYFDISDSSVHNNAKVKLRPLKTKVVVECPFRENGAGKK